MAYRMTGISALNEAPFDAIIDVRSPSEFAEDRLPGAINLPVLSDEERARVGTIYSQDAPFNARKIGAALVARNAAGHLDGPLADKDGAWQPLVYCWRGGQRSNSFASILKQIGWRVAVLEGGYQSYRRLVVAALYERDMPSRVILLDGNTGTAKTDVLRRLRSRGVQAIDLEGLANHRGSALGGQGPQPSQKAFESSVAQHIARLDPDRPVVVEAESSKIGCLNLPPRLFSAMKSAPRITLHAPLSARAAYLSQAYADVTNDLTMLEERLGRLMRLQGRETVERWIDLARAGAFEELATELIERHYDPRYAKVRARAEGTYHRAIETDSLEDDALETLSDAVAEAVNAL